MKHGQHRELPPKSRRSQFWGGAKRHRPEVARRWLAAASRVAASRGERLVVVAEVGGRTTALEVDAIRERLEVVLKPMQGLLSKARGYAGTTLLGDGGVLLVLDLRDILP